MWLRLSRGLGVLSSVVIMLGCGDSQPAVGPERIPGGGAVAKTLNADLFSYACDYQDVTISSDGDGSPAVMWSHIAKKITATNAPQWTDVGWKSEVHWQWGILLQTTGHSSDAPWYKSAWLMPTIPNWSIVAQYYVRYRDSNQKMHCGTVNSYVRSDVPFSWKYQDGTLTSYKLAVGQQVTIQAHARNSNDQPVPSYTNEVDGDPIPSQNLTAASSNTAVSSVGATTLPSWFLGQATFTGVAPGLARARWSLRGYTDSSFVIEVCAPGPTIATSVVIAPSGPVSLQILGPTLTPTYTARNCTGAPIGGAITVTSDNPYVASVVSGVISAQHAGTARIIAQRDGAADTLVVNVPQPQIVLELVGPAFVPRYSFCAWQVFVSGPPPGATLNYSWTKAGWPIGSNVPSVTGVPTGGEGFEIRVTVSNPDGVYPTETASIVVEMDDSPNAMCSEDAPRVVLLERTHQPM